MRIINLDLLVALGIGKIFSVGFDYCAYLRCVSLNLNELSMVLRLARWECLAQCGLHYSRPGPCHFIVNHEATVNTFAMYIHSSSMKDL
jgi:hypothetical protein